MTQVSAARADECERVVARASAWIAQQPGVIAAALVGSWTRGAADMDSDLDVVVLADDPDSYRDATNWIEPATGEDAPVVRTHYWGVLLERRVQLASGFEVEFGFVAPSWADTDPVDDGTASVVERGFRVLYDPSGVMERLAAAVSRRGPAGG